MKRSEDFYNEQPGLFWMLCDELKRLSLPEWIVIVGLFAGLALVFCA